jgi:hypothetical protein
LYLVEEFDCSFPVGVEWFSILEPLLFLFINDIVTDIKASIKLFADDTSLYVTVDIPQNHTQSKALLRSQNTTLISFPLSKALPKSFEIFTN